MAIFNEWAREISDRHGTTLVDMWRMRDVGPRDEWMDVDRMHLNAVGHQHIAIAVLDALDLDHDLAQLDRAPAPSLVRRERVAADLRWARTHFAPWVHRRLTGRSWGDGVERWRPTVEPITPGQ